LLSLLPAALTEREQGAQEGAVAAAQEHGERDAGDDDAQDHHATAHQGRDQ
jgi:hypothetical protein